MSDFSLEDLNLTKFIPDEYDEVADALLTFAMQDSGKWKSRQRIVIRKRLEKVARNLTSINDRFREGKIDEKKYRMLLRINTLAMENIEIEEDLLDEQARQLVVKRGKEVVAAIAEVVTGLNVRKVLGLP
jgi:hypothetical protein